VLITESDTLAVVIGFGMRHTRFFIIFKMIFFIIVD